jgi:glycerophosphoryl diester phosphodiesterase
MITRAAYLPAIAFDLQGHRGARGLAPENTIASFSTALAIGVTTLELDVGMTKDGVVVVHHDEWLNPDITRGADGTFLSQRPHDGARIPTLAEVFALGRRADHIRFNIETKLTPTSGADVAEPEPFAKAVAAAVREAGFAERVSIQSFDWRILRVLRRIEPDLLRGGLTSEQPDYDTIQRGKPGASPWTAGLDVAEFGGSVPRLVAAAGCRVWSPAFEDLTSECIAEASALGIRVIPWIVNEPDQMDRLVRMGVAGIITDYPDRLRRVLAANNVPLPPRVSIS